MPVPATRVSVPAPSSPSGVLFRVGLKSDATELTIGAAGTLWIVAAGDRAELIQAPIVLRPSGGAASAAAQFQLQAGAFSQEEPARRLLERLTTSVPTAGDVAFSADRGVYRVLVGSFATREEAEALQARLKEQGQESFVVPGSPRPAGVPASIVVTGAGSRMELPSPLDVFPPAPDVRVGLDGVTYRGSLRVVVNSRATLNVIDRVDLEEYLYGVVPAEMGPKRFDALEALKAQAVAARTYALAHRGQFESEGYDLCATPKCQVYAGVPAEDPLSTAAVDATRGLVIAWQGQFADALFVSTCGGTTENVENVFSGGPVPYLVSVECGEIAPFELTGAALPKEGGSRPRSPLAWRGYVLRRHASPGAAPRAAALETAQGWAGVPRRGSPPARLTPSAVYPSLIAAFGLADAAALHLTPRDDRYYAELPSAASPLSGAAREAYEFLLRFKFAGDTLPPPDRDLDEDEYAGLLFSADLRLLGVTEGSGRLLSREGSHLWIKGTEGRQELPVDPEVPLARRIGDAFHPARTLTLRAGDRLRFYKRDGRVLAIWVEMESDGPAFERESAWTEWVRRVSGKELARRMSGRVAGNVVRDITVTKRSPSGRAVEMRVQTDLAEATFRRFELRQAVEMPEMLFTVTRVDGADGPDFVFLGRGWGHGVGMCQNGAFGMALAGAPYDQILRRYYTGVDIVPSTAVQAGPPSTR